MFFPHMQEARLLDDQDPNAILEATGAPVSNPPAPLGVGMGGAPMSPTAPPMASQGMFNYTPDADLQRQSNIMGMFSNINRVGGGGGLVNPFEKQIAQNQELAQKRYQALQTAQKDNPFHAYEEAKSRGYFTLGANEDDTAGLRRFTQEQFKDPSQSVYGQKMDDITALMGGDRGAASKLANGLLEVRTDPYGGQGVYDLSTNQFTTAYSPDQIASGKALIAGAEGQATGKAANDWDVVKQVETSLSTLADEWEASNAGVMRGREALALLESGEVEPGLVAGTVLDYLGIGSSKLAYYQNLSQQQLFEELGSATLTPVSDADIRALAKLFTSASQSPDVAKGNLEAFLSRKEREQERKSGRMRREIRRIDDADYRDGLSETYQPFIDFKAISSWDNVPGGE
jgi:hypothetical protein